MSILNSDLKLAHLNEDKENSCVTGSVKNSKNEIKLQPYFQGPISRLEDDEEADKLMQAKRKMKFQSVQNYTFTLKSCSEE
jgi:hypothetical protein